MKAIETRYNGYRFRSRLEARWAVFFDTIGIAYEYEPEGYEFEDGTRYLPDFWLPTFSGGMWAEVKPDDPMPAAVEKAENLVMGSKHSLWWCVGTPAFRTYEVMDYDGFSDPPGIDWIDGMPLIDQAYGEDRMFWTPEWDDETWHSVIGIYDEYRIAVEAARSARFEHGEMIQAMEVGR